MMKFGYEKLFNLKDPVAKPIPLPVIEVDFSVAKLYCLVDSGASHSFIPADIGRKLGLKIENGKKLSSTGITGSQFISYLHKIKYEIGGWEYEAEVGFTDSLGVPFGILGRNGFFEFFVVKIIHSKEEIELKDLTR